MMRRLLNVAAILSFAFIVGLSAACLWSRLSVGAVDVAHFGQWHLWIIDDVFVLASFGPESNAIQPATLSGNLQWVMAPLAAYVVVWGAFALRRFRRQRKGRGFPVEVSSCSTNQTRNESRH